MKQKKNMVLLGAIFLVLVIIYIALNMWNKNKEEQAAQEAEDATIHLVEAEKLDKICYTDGATTMSFVKEDGTWYYEEDKEIFLILRGLIVSILLLSGTDMEKVKYISNKAIRNWSLKTVRLIVFALQRNLMLEAVLSFRQLRQTAR